MEAKKVAAKGTEAKRPTEVNVAVMDSKWLSPADVSVTMIFLFEQVESVSHARLPLQLKKCEALPSKKELYATIAGLAKQPATKIATGIKMIPTKLAIAMKKV